MRIAIPVGVTLRAVILLGAAAAAIAAGLAVEPLRWTAIGVAVGVATVLAIHRLAGVDATFRGRPPAAVALLLPLLPVLGLATHRTHGGIQVAIAAALTIVGWFFGLRPALWAESATFDRRDLVAPSVVGFVVLASAADGSSVASSLLLACLLLWVSSLLAIIVRGSWRFARGNAGAEEVLKQRAVMLYRWLSTAAVAATLALVLANAEVVKIDGPLAVHVQAIARAGNTPAVATAAAIRRTNGNFRGNLLVHVFAPRMFLSDDNQIWPTHPWVDIFDSQVIDRRNGKTTRATSPDAIPSSCSDGTPGPCYVLSDKCFEASARCGNATGSLTYPYGVYVPPGGTSNRTLLPFGVVYVRLIDRNRASQTDTLGSARAVFRNVRLAEANFPDTKITSLIQYWFYYRYDRWQANTVFGRLIQEHESDWEGMTIGLSNERPVFVAYSAHCGGEWLPWRDVPAVTSARDELAYLASRPANDAAQRRPLSDSQKHALEGLLSAAARERTHPAIMVAAGSQGTYPASGRLDIPDWTTCALHTSWGNALTLAAGATEKVNLTVEVVPVGVYAATAKKSPMDFAGWWGLNNRKRLILPFGITLSIGGNADTAGPPSPPFQPMWRDPFGQIFGARTWHRAARP